MFIENFKTKKSIPFIALPFFLVILIQCLTLQNSDATSSFFCFAGGFLCGYVPQFIFDQKTKAREFFKSLVSGFSSPETDRK